MSMQYANTDDDLGESHTEVQAATVTSSIPPFSGGRLPPLERISGVIWSGNILGEPRTGTDKRSLSLLAPPSITKMSKGLAEQKQ